MLLTTFNLLTSLLIVLLTLLIATSTVIENGYSKKATSNVFSESQNVQNSPDTNQNIIKRIAELQKQIDELRRQILTLPAGPPGPPGSAMKLVTIQSEKDGTSPGQQSSAAFQADCNSDEVVTGGGYKPEPGQIIDSIRANGNGWRVEVENALQDNPWSFTVFAECAHLEPVP